MDHQIKQTWKLPVISIKTPVEYGMTQHLSIDPRTGIPPPPSRHRYRNQYIARLGVQEARDNIKEDMVSSFLRASIEKYEPFKQRMAANWLSQNFYMNTSNAFKTQNSNPIPYSNPFGPHNNKYQSHPVTRHLSSAASAVRTHDVVAMMEERKTDIDYLESQYRRMVRE
ncbi:hypothetical protein DID88_006968 [Monilinia fructigena]|uniref:Uncharacterized protein n=1 Tax=Monilinia fructigena TaxID=38457 RepID=A0A395IH53_9HELO|nr:hypothetical protein DID88_006968 [Monilinia fructigena]